VDKEVGVLVFTNGHWKSQPAWLEGACGGRSVVLDSDQYFDDKRLASCAVKLSTPDAPASGLVCWIQKTALSLSWSAASIQAAPP
jgi:hypothetical protein